MAWQDDMVSMLRVVIDDAGSNPEYTNARLEEVIVVAAHFTKKDVDFDSDYTISIAEVSITPDPITGKDYPFVNLVTLRAACLLANSEYKTAGARAVSVRDGSSAIDQRGVADSRKNWRDMICQDYATAEREYRMGNSQAGEAIVGPYSQSPKTGTHRSRGVWHS